MIDAIIRIELQIRYGRIQSPWIDVLDLALYATLGLGLTARFCS